MCGSRIIVTFGHSNFEIQIQIILKNSNATSTKYLITFLQTINVANSYRFLFGFNTNIIFVLTNNYLSHR